MNRILRLDAFSLPTFHDAVKTASRWLRGSPSADDAAAYMHPVWARGHSMHSYSLVPSLLRTEPGKPALAHDQAHLAEESRTQHFAARAYHLIDSKPKNNIEWQEIMQHHDVKTRLMDWSENVNVALLFALEAFITNPNDKKYMYTRVTCTPTIWLLDPIKLNEIVYDKLSANPKVVKTALSEFGCVSERAVNNFQYTLLSGKRKYLTSDNFSLTSIISISRLHELRESSSANLKNLIQNNEFNPFFYLLLRIYGDGIPLQESLPPVAMVHPYHSPRIATQHGAFTIFPFPDSMSRTVPLEGFDDCLNCLCEIRLLNPQKIANDLREGGYSHTDLYPELVEYGRSIEWR